MINLTVAQKESYKILIKLGDSKELALKTVLSDMWKKTKENHRLQLIGA